MNTKRNAAVSFLMMGAQHLGIEIFAKDSRRMINATRRMPTAIRTSSPRLTPMVKLSDGGGGMKLTSALHCKRHRTGPSALHNTCFA